MGGLHDRPAAHGHDRTRRRLDVQRFERQHHAGDVHQGINATDFVEVWVRRAVHGRLCPGEGIDRRQGARRHPVRQPRPADDLAHLLGLVLLLPLDQNPQVERIHAGPRHPGGFEVEARQSKLLERALDLRERRACVDERRQRHVPGDAGEAVEHGDAAAAHRSSLRGGCAIASRLMVAAR
ncbi:MAG: hypothetical protein U5Q44_06655 [Dehalococcoidia bacterium]|nr:hypothetical protein [Dehalococcoidia bacterium]